MDEYFNESRVTLVQKKQGKSNGTTTEDQTMDKQKAWN